MSLVLSGGGARAAYQAGVLSYIADNVGDPDFRIITGVSAGSINAAHLANDLSGFDSGVERLTRSWLELKSDDVYEARSSMNVIVGMLRGTREYDELFPRFGLVDVSPLRETLKMRFDTEDGHLKGIAEKIRTGRLKACSIAGTNYGTGQTVSWVQGAEIQGWERPARVSVHEELTVEHILASSSLPFLFPAIQVGDDWYGDGGIRQAEPLSPAVHLGADRILAISTRYGRSKREADRSAIEGYPPAAQIFGILLNAVFLDRLDQDAMTLTRLNDLLRSAPPWRRRGLRPIDLLVIRPSVDLGRMSGDFQHDLDGFLSLISRGLGSKDTKSPDWLSMILFEQGYMERLVDIGYEDARSQHDRLIRFVDPDTPWEDDLDM
ncbi:MAG: patatin [Rhodothermales bacterium]|nr:patatin [Rhodothermales bacterium]